MRGIQSIVVLILSFFYAQNVLLGQCPEGVLHLVSDEEIASFAKQYPNCTELDSSLIIGPNSYMAETRISKIEGLKNIRTVNGDLVVDQNPWLKDISVLNKLEKVSGNVHLRGNDITAGLDNSSLVVIGGDLKYFVGINTADKQYHFPELIKIGGNLEAYLYKENKTRFPQLWQVGGNVRLENWELVHLDNEFPSLERVEGTLELKLSTDTDAKVFRKLKYAKTIRLDISYAPKQVFFGDLDSCESVFIKVKPGAKILGFHKLQYLDYLGIENASPSVLNAFSNLREARYIEVGKRDGDLHGVFQFPKLKSVQELKLRSGGLSSILRSGLDVKKLRIQELSFADKTYLNTEELYIDRLVYFQTKFTSLPVLGGLHFNALEISGNRMLTSLDGFVYKKNPLQLLQIESCSALENLDGIDVSFSENAKLRISSNSKLETCAAPWLCEALKSNLNIVIQSNKACSKANLKLECAIEED